MFEIRFVFAIFAFVEIEFSSDNQQIDNEKHMLHQSVHLNAALTPPSACHWLHLAFVWLDWLDCSGQMGLIEDGYFDGKKKNKSQIK